MTTFSAQEIEILCRAAREGEAFAKGLSVGSEFIGVQPPARERFPDDKLAQTVFETVALHFLRDLKIFVEPDAPVISRILPRS